MKGWTFTLWLLVGVFLVSVAAQFIVGLTGHYSYPIFWIVFIGGTIGLFIWGYFSNPRKHH